MKQLRLKPWVKVVLLLLIAFAGVFVIVGKVKTGKIDLSKKLQLPTKKTEIEVDNDGNVINYDKESEDTINLSLDEWIGWKEIIDANGGLTTQHGSIYDDLGIKVNISIINDATQSSSAMISGDLDAAGYTVNRTAFLQNKFSTAGLDVIMPYVTNFSNGGDGIIAKSNIETVDDLVNAKIGVPEFSEAQTLVVWFVNNSDLSDSDKQQIIDNLILFATPDEAAKAFFAGEVDVAATWEPYLSQAQSMSESHIFFSTAYSSSLVMDGILFNKEFAEKNADVVTKFIQGGLKAAELYEKDMDTIKTVMPMFSTASDQDIIDNCAGAKLTTYADNMKLLGEGGNARAMYMDMCNIWVSLGETSDSSTVNDIFTTAYIAPLSGEFSSTEVTKTDAIVDATTVDENTLTSDQIEAILDGTANVTFVKNTATFDDPTVASETLDTFIKNAKILDGSIIVLEGNTDPNPDTDPTDEYNIQLSYSRANAVKQYFVLNGIDANRIVVVGNGSSKPLYDNDSEEHRALNRRTDISFKVIEQ